MSKKHFDKLLTFCQFIAILAKTIKGVKMFLFFNKQFRLEQNLISELAKKIKKSVSFDSCYGGNNSNTEIYKLDNLDIWFDITNRKIIVFDKSGAEITSLDCHYDELSDMQKARTKWFHDLLCKVARGRKDAEAEKQKKLQAAEKKAEKKQVANWLKIQQELQQKSVQAALDKVRSL